MKRTLQVNVKMTQEDADARTSKSAARDLAAESRPVARRIGTIYGLR